MEDKCPFTPDNEVIRDMSKVVSSKNGEFIDGDGVVNESKEVVFVQGERDVTKFCKLFDFAIFTQLSKAGVALLCYAMKFVGYDGKVVLNQEYYTKKNRYKTSHTFYTAIEELKNMNVIKETSMRGLYWLNPNIACRGDRSKIFGIQNRFKKELEE